MTITNIDTEPVECQESTEDEGGLRHECRRVWMHEGRCWCPCGYHWTEE